MDKLITGYRKFRETEWLQERERFESLAAEGQSPEAMVLACSDSRVDPQMILGARPGELFVVRNVANLVPPYERDDAYHGTSAALEFGVRTLKVAHLIVLGHGMCGGVKALVDGCENDGSDYTGHWMGLARDALAVTAGVQPLEARLKACEEETVKVSLRNLMTFPWIAEAVAEARLQLHGAYFDIRHGVLHMLEPDGGFRPVPGGGEAK